MVCELVGRDCEVGMAEDERLLKRTAAEASSEVAPADWPRLTIVAPGTAASTAAAAGAPQSGSKT